MRRKKIISVSKRERNNNPVEEPSSETMFGKLFDDAEEIIHHSKSTLKRLRSS